MCFAIQYINIIDISVIRDGCILFSPGGLESTSPAAHSIPSFQHPSHSLLKANGFQQQLYYKYRRNCLKGACVCVCSSSFGSSSGFLPRKQGSNGFQHIHNLHQNKVAMEHRNRADCRCVVSTQTIQLHQHAMYPQLTSAYHEIVVCGMCCCCGTANHSP